jgi:hypothetical protein
MPVQPFATASVLLKDRNVPLSDISMRELIQVEETRTFVLKCDFINNRNSTVIKLRKFILRV